MRRSIPVVAATLGLALTLTACSGSADSGDDRRAHRASSAGAHRHPRRCGSTTPASTRSSRSSPTFTEDPASRSSWSRRTSAEIQEASSPRCRPARAPTSPSAHTTGSATSVTNGVVAPVELGDSAGDFQQVADRRGHLRGSGLRRAAPRSRTSPSSATLSSPPRRPSSRRDGRSWARRRAPSSPFIGGARSPTRTTCTPSRPPSVPRCSEE